MKHNNQIVLCVAPHPDDETLGCGGTLLRHCSDGLSVHWLIVTAMTAGAGFDPSRIASRDSEIERVSREYGFTDVHRCGLPTTSLDQLGMSTLVTSIGRVMSTVKPNIVYLPYRYDAHTDHGVVADAVTSCCKSFRHPSISSVRAYETLSETEFGMRANDTGFRPNLFVDITAHLDKKLEIMRCYAGELGQHPFPRSEAAIRALATYRGAVAGATAAEAFMILREILQ